MIQEIAPKTFDPAFRRQKPEDRDFLLHYEYNKVMLKKEGDRLMIPTVGELLEEAPEIAAKAEYLFSIDDRAYFGMPDMAVPEFGGYVMEGMQIFRKFDPMYQGFAGITGGQIYRFRESRKFCGRCGQRMEYSQTERAMVCPGCKQTEYPKISPAVIVAITNGDKLLMSRYAHGTYRHFALIAGYVEVGETFEECVRREVMEEVGLKVKNIRYYKSQPWAFSDTVMIGFTAELDGDDTIRLQEEELSEAGWYTRDQMEDYSPCISVGHEMMRAFKSGTL
ncbi:MULTISPECIES: NAD(+) diphosphatase [Enterocloster]|uniref:NAD(+) diphosphatase n=1 Tax=Enterocloster lavalensis TaxID=460384 RepID=A0A1I0J3A5_9FIRM|nr:MULTISPECIES: NAD(+) diphosphatase [Enterocloster]MDR3758821.1 NAD(+) diphosphatase [Enterocloster sp.]PST33921.1 NAD(+) diphosphatase [Enterocloster lavalensis]SEU03552.1 NAD+ diphosphatase [Enterocloster lavalensis]